MLNLGLYCQRTQRALSLGGGEAIPAKVRLTLNSAKDGREAGQGDAHL